MEVPGEWAWNYDKAGRWNSRRVASRHVWVSMSYGRFQHLLDYIVFFVDMCAVNEEHYFDINPTIDVTTSLIPDHLYDKCDCVLLFID